MAPTLDNPFSEIHPLRHIYIKPRRERAPRAEGIAGQGTDG
jgi:hypothetical protein